MFSLDAGAEQNLMHDSLFFIYSMSTFDIQAKYTVSSGVESLLVFKENPDVPVAISSVSAFLHNPHFKYFSPSKNTSF